MYSRSWRTHVHPVPLDGKAARVDCSRLPIISSTSQQETVHTHGGGVRRAHAAWFGFDAQTNVRRKGSSRAEESQARLQAGISTCPSGRGLRVCCRLSARRGSRVTQVFQVNATSTSVFGGFTWTNYTITLQTQQPETTSSATARLATGAKPCSRLWAASTCNHLHSHQPCHSLATCCVLPNASPAPIYDHMESDY